MQATFQQAANSSTLRISSMLRISATCMQIVVTIGADVSNSLQNMSNSADCEQLQGWQQTANYSSLQIAVDCKFQQSGDGNRLRILHLTADGDELYHPMIIPMFRTLYDFDILFHIV
jgi:hypothetical protein